MISLCPAAEEVRACPRAVSESRVCALLPRAGSLQPGHLGPCGCACLGAAPLRAEVLVSGGCTSYPSSAPLPPHISSWFFGRMSERDIQSLSKWVFVLTLCLTTLWGRLTLASTHHRSHSGREATSSVHVSHSCAIVLSPQDTGGTLGSPRVAQAEGYVGLRRLVRVCHSFLGGRMSAGGLGS